MKLNNNKELNKIAKAALAAVLAGSFTFTGSKAFADSGTTQPDTTVQATAQTDTTAAVSSEPQEAPALVPGDFFYFLKIALEKIQLALTFDDAKEAKVLAANASERLKEAEALFAAGEQDKAIETIKEAVKEMEKSDQLANGQHETDKPADEVKNEAKTTDDQTSADEVKDENQAADDQKAADEVKDENKADEQTSANEVKDETQSADDQKATDEKKDENKADEQTSPDNEKVVPQNVIALTAALEKVKNPTARAALQRNIEKTYARIAKKLEEWQKHLADKQAKHEKHMQKDTAAEPSKTSTAAEPSKTSTAAEVSTTVQAPAADDNNNTPAASATAGTTVQHKPVKQDVQKQLHHEVNQMQEQAKQKREEVLKFVKQKKEEVKHNWKESKNGHVGKKHE